MVIIIAKVVQYTIKLVVFGVIIDQNGDMGPPWALQRDPKPPLTKPYWVQGLQKGTILDTKTNINSTTNQHSNK